ncbi:MAG TPA: hypothetical protein VNF29_04990 [Candidatus Binataceae bacterium]|nr:hypothetical protein [Candidatus Binataceae bacterium]
MMVMTLMAVGVFAADLAAVAAIVGSMFLERWLGLSRRMILDCIFIVAASYGVAAWFIGMWIKRTMDRQQSAPAQDEVEDAVAIPESARAPIARRF